MLFQKYLFVAFGRSDRFQWEKSYRTIITLCENLKATRPKPYIGRFSGSTTLKPPLMAVIRKSKGTLTLILSYRKIINTPWHGRRYLEDTCLIFLSTIQTLRQLVLMKVTQRDQILLLSRAPIFIIQMVLRTGKPAMLLIHLQYNLQNPNSMVKVKTLRPQQTYVILIVPIKLPSQTLSLILHTNLYIIHHRARATPFND